MKKSFWLLFLFVTLSSFGQSLSDYKYVLLPNTFSFQKMEHQYDLNRMTQFLLNKYDFEAFIEGENSNQLKDIDACELLRLKANMKGYLTSNVVFNFIDCKGQVVYSSREGVSRRKEFKESYIEAIRNVFNDLMIKNHRYIKKSKVLTSKKAEAIPVIKSEKPSPLKTEVFQLQFELREKQYSFVPVSKISYSILQNSKVIGKAIKLKNSNIYKIEAGTLSGSGYFDDFGNFILKRINPANQKELIDTMNRVK